MEIVNILVVLAVGMIIVAMVSAYNEYKNSKISKISFREAFDLTELPIITFKNGEKKLNFLLDTGSTDSHINKDILENTVLGYTPTNYGKEVFGMEGNKVTIRIVEMTLTLNGNKFEENFLVNDLSAAFSQIKEENGVTLHGILGTSFFEKYKYVIDFKKYIAYSKK